MFDINRYYNIGQVYHISQLNVKSVNNLYKITTNSGEYILKKYIPKYNKVAMLSLNAQAKSYEYLNIAPKVIQNRSGKLLSESNGIFFSLQEFVNGSDFILTPNNACLFLDAITQLHNCLNFIYADKLIETKIQEIKHREIINEINNSREKYNNFKKTNDSYERLLDTRMVIAEEFPYANYEPKYQSIIHGDIRPSNLINFSNNIKFIDFDYITNGDLLYEISSSIALLSKFDKNTCEIFWGIYCNQNKLSMDFRQLYMHLLTYYLKSNFPLSIIEYESRNQIERMSLERIKLLEFCYNIIK